MAYGMKYDPTLTPIPLLLPIPVPIPIPIPPLAQATSASADMHNLELFQDMVVLTFGSQRFRVQGCSEINSVRVVRVHT
jgi:hypothetical protein